jgi:hypothetical protein
MRTRIHRSSLRGAKATWQSRVVGVALDCRVAALLAMTERYGAGCLKIESGWSYRRFPLTVAMRACEVLDPSPRDAVAKRRPRRATARLWQRGRSSFEARCRERLRMTVCSEHPLRRQVTIPCNAPAPHGGRSLRAARRNRIACLLWRGRSMLRALMSGVDGEFRCARGV